MLKLMTSVMLERPIVFIHDNLAVLTSVVLAFKILMRPFQYCYMLVPVMPEVLLD